MATPYSDVYAVFLSKVRDYSFLNFTQEEAEEDFEKWLKSSIVEFRRCKSDLKDRDNELKQFNNDLSEDEIEILSVFMVTKYLSSILVTSELLRPVMTDADFKIYSQANHIKEISNLRKDLRKEANQLLVGYSYYNGLGDLE